MNVSCVSRQCSPDSGSSSSVSSGPGSAMTRPAVWRDDNGCRAVSHQEAGPVRLSEQQHVHPAVPAAEPDQQQHQHRAGLLQLAGPVPDHPREVRPNPWWSRHWWHSAVTRSSYSGPGLYRHWFCSGCLEFLSWALHILLCSSQYRTFLCLKSEENIRGDTQFLHLFLWILLMETERYSTVRRVVKFVSS